MTLNRRDNACAEIMKGGLATAKLLKILPSATAGVQSRRHPDELQKPLNLQALDELRTRQLMFSVNPSGHPLTQLKVALLMQRRTDAPVQVL